jgi:hypothetical protein
MESAASSPEDFAQRFEATFAQLQVAILDACGREAGWPAKVAAGMRAGFDLAAADPVLVQTLTNDALARGADGIARYERPVSYEGRAIWASVLPLAGPSGRREADFPKRPSERWRAGS